MDNERLLYNFSMIIFPIYHNSFIKLYNKLFIHNKLFSHFFINNKPIATISLETYRKIYENDRS